ncbi:MAG: hypothetical protein WDM81_13785 [Rhizomicrobium sp.]
MQLSAWLKKKKMGYAAFGTLAGLPRVTVRQYALGLRTRIDPENLRKIVTATEGKVTADDFYGDAATFEAAE